MQPRVGNDIVSWLVDRGITDDKIGDLLAGLCGRIHATGVPLWRGHLSIATLHPQLSALS
jgi:hypothetical protein